VALSIGRALLTRSLFVSILESGVSSLLIAAFRPRVLGPGHKHSKANRMACESGRAKRNGAKKARRKAKRTSSHNKRL
jgi:hypothetical protein